VSVLGRQTKVQRPSCTVCVVDLKSDVGCAAGIGILNVKPT
jgi:hypothetical protein